MKKRLFIAIASMLALGQGAWADEKKSFPLHYDEATNPEDGTATHPYLIESVDDLNTLASDVNSGTIYSGVYFKLTADLDYKNATFTPIGMGDELGDVAKPFVGIFDGNDKTIRNITYSSDGIGVGLFGYIFSPAVIKNINLVDCSFTGNSSVGAIVGNSSGSSDADFGIYNCTVTSTTVSAVTDKEEEYPALFAGGIIGYCGKLIVSNCTSSATVSGSSCVGGIAGLLYEGTIDNCFYTGSTAFNNATTGKIAGDRGGYDDEDKFIQGSEGTISLTLFDDDSEETIKNAGRITYYKDVEDVDVTLSGRTLYKDGDWNTLCLPFSLTAAQVTGLSPAKLMTLSESSFAEGVLTINFAEATTIEAGKPYLIKWGSSENKVNPSFEGVTISSSTLTNVETTYVDFVGTFSPVALTANDKSVLFLGTGNKLYYPSAAKTVNPFRAYFALKNITAGDAPDGARRFVLNFGDDATGIKTVNSYKEDTWYTLDGRRLNSRPTQKGLYIINGKKTVIK